MCKLSFCSEEGIPTSVLCTVLVYNQRLVTKLNKVSQVNYNENTNISMKYSLLFAKEGV